MNEHEMSDLLERAGSGLEPDVASLVAGGTTRGRARRRRRRVVGGAATGGLAAVALTGVLVALPGGSDPGGSTPVASDPAASERPSAPLVPVPAERTLAVTQAEVAQTFGSLVSGVVEESPQKEVRDEAPIVDFRLDGFAARIGFTPSDYRTGEAEARGPMERCEYWGQQLPCRQLPGGTVVQTKTWVLPSGEKQSSAFAYFPDGWDASAVVHNTAVKEGQPIAARPPLTPRQLVDVLTSDVWFD